MFFAVSASQGSETNEWSCMPNDARQVWFTDSRFLVSNVALKEAFRIIEDKSREADPSGRGVSIVDIRMPITNDQSRISFSSDCNIASALLGCNEVLGQGQNLSASPCISFLGRTAIVGDKEVFVISNTLVIECVDAKTIAPVNDVVLTPLSDGVFNTRSLVGIIENKKVIVWTVQLLMPVVVGAGASATLVDKNIWKRVFRYRVNAKGYDDKDCQHVLFGNGNDSNYVFVKLNKSSAGIVASRQATTNEILSRHGSLIKGWGGGGQPSK